MWPFSLLKWKTAAHPEGILYVFRDRMFKDGASQPVFQIGLRSFVETYIREDEFESLFGGYAARSIGGERYIGVWSVRVASRMRRILRERGAVYSIVRGRPTNA